MFARNVSIRLKPGKLNEFTRTFDEEVLSILRKQPGFREEITFASPGEMELIAISLWDTKEQADAYNASGYPKVLQAVSDMLDGTPRVQNLNVISSTMQHAGTGSGRSASASSATQPAVERCRPQRKTRRSQRGSWRNAGTKGTRTRCAI